MDEEDVENRVAVGATRETRETEAATETEEEAGADVVRVVQNQERQEGQKRVSVVDVLAWAPGQAPTLAPTLTPETPEQRDVERLKEALELANEEMQRMADEVLRAGAAEEAAVLAVAAWEREGVQMRGEIQRLQSQKRRSFHTDITVADVEVEVEVKVEAEVEAEVEVEAEAEVEAEVEAATPEAPEGEGRESGVEGDTETVESADAGLGVVHLCRLRLLAVNALVSVYHSLGRQRDNGVDAAAGEVAFFYALCFLRQVMAHPPPQSPTAPTPSELSYPLSWLLSLFPHSTASLHPSLESAWLPLHFALAVGGAGEGGGRVGGGAYLSDLETLLESFGASAFDEDVSPLSVAVASSHPYLQAVQLVLRHSPSSVSLPDADGSLPLMHACGANAEAGVVSHLYGLYPDALRLQDNFGCGAIHYAAYSGTAEVVRFLLSQDPDIASMTEGNGALPLHDAVQNVRNEVGVVRNEVGFAGEEDSVGMGDTPHNSLAIVEVLLGVNPLAARKRDDFGALPLHRAAKFASLGVVMAVHAAFPEAVFAPDREGLLPLHYYSQRPASDKTHHLDLLKFLLSTNPDAKTLDDGELFGAGGGQGGQGLWSKIASWASGAKPTTTSETREQSVMSGISSASGPTGERHSRRKSVMPVQSELRKQFK